MIWKQLSSNFELSSASKPYKRFKPMNYAFAFILGLTKFSPFRALHTHQKRCGSLRDSEPER